MGRFTDAVTVAVCVFTIQVLLDASHVSSRQALEGFGQCLEPLLKAADCELLLPLLSALLRLADHSYWLVKVGPFQRGGSCLTIHAGR